MPKSRLFFALLAPACLLCHAFAQQGPSGRWEGAIKLSGNEIPIVVDLALDAKGAWIGTFARGAQEGNRGNVPLADITVSGKSVRFRIAASTPAAPQFDCTIGAAASMECALANAGGAETVVLQRTGEAKVDLPKPSPAVSKELEGDWEGAVEAPAGPIKVVLHFQNQPDNTVKATMDAPNQDALPLTDVVQEGAAVGFRMRIVNGAYKGMLNKEGTELTGQWTQGAASLPLTLKKSMAR